MKVYVENKFHGTATVLHVREDWTISRGQYRALWTRLCGFTGCRCEGQVRFYTDKTRRVNATFCELRDGRYAVEIEGEMS